MSFPRLLPLLLCVLSPLPGLAQSLKPGAEGKPAAPGACTHEAQVLGTGTRDAAGASHLVGGDGVPDLVLAVRSCSAGPLSAVEVRSGDDKLLWDSSRYTEAWAISIASQQEPDRLLQREEYTDDRVPLAGGKDASPTGKGLELAFYVSADGPERQAFQAHPAGKVVLKFRAGTSEEIPISPPPSPLPPRLAALLKDPRPDPLKVLRDFESNDPRRFFDAVVALTGAVKRLEPKQTLPILERALRQPPKDELLPDLKRAAALQAVRALGPDAAPLAPLLAEQVLGNGDISVLQQVLLAMGAAAGPALLAASTEESLTWNLFEQLEPREDYYVRLLPILTSQNARASATAARLMSCGDVVSRRGQLQRAAKDPQAVEAARRALEHPSDSVREVAAAVTAWAGDRSDPTQRGLRLGLLQCGYEPEIHKVYAELLAQMPPPSASDDLVISVVSSASPASASEKGYGVLEPLLYYHQGQWEAAVSQQMTGPQKWLAMRRPWETMKLSRVGMLRTATKTTEYTSDCGNKGWGFRVSGSDQGARLALSKDIPLAGFEPAPAKQSQTLDQLEASQSTGILEAAKQAFQKQAAAQCNDKALAGLTQNSVDARPKVLLCTSSPTGLGQLCYTRRVRFFHSPTADPPDACGGQCLSELWTMDSGEGPRVFSTNRHCELGESGDGGTPPIAAFTVEGRTFILADMTCYEGCDGFQVLEASPTGVRSLVEKSSDAACD